MSKRKAIRKLLRLKILWAGLFVASVIVAFWYAPKLNEPITSDPVKIGFIGDSITRGVKNIRSPVETEVAVLGNDFVAINQGRGGTSSTSWLPGHQLFDDTIAIFKAQNVHVVSIMLGTNDARKDIATTPAIYEKNL
jgi:lysophospholipase L1-like esterase